jgi:hypothetical protein
MTEVLSETLDFSELDHCSYCPLNLERRGLPALCYRLYEVYSRQGPLKH